MMLAGFEMPTYGEISWQLGDQPAAAPQAQHRHGVPELRAVPPHDGRPERAFPLSVRRMAREDIGEKVERAHGDGCGFPSSPPPVRPNCRGPAAAVALARALVFEHELVLMDEPLGALDKQLREQMQIEIKHLHESLGLTVVYVTHGPVGSADHVEPRWRCSSDGIIQQIDDPRTLYEERANSLRRQLHRRDTTTSTPVGRPSTAMSAASSRGRCRTPDGQAGSRCSAPESRSTLSIRPERISPWRRSRGRRSTAFRARRRRHLFGGPPAGMIVETAGNPQVKVKLAAGDGQASVRAGEPVDLWFRAEDCRALDRLREPAYAMN
jgi:putative spermidine/putrescine transport system ATP-binding protein